MSWTRPVRRSMERKPTAARGFECRDVHTALAFVLQKLDTNQQPRGASNTATSQPKMPAPPDVYINSRAGLRILRRRPLQSRVSTAGTRASDP